MERRQDLIRLRCRERLVEGVGVSGRRVGTWHIALHGGSRVYQWPGSARAAARPYLKFTRLDRIGMACRGTKHRFMMTAQGRHELRRLRVQGMFEMSIAPWSPGRYLLSGTLDRGYGLLRGRLLGMA